MAKCVFPVVEMDLTEHPCGDLATTALSNSKGHLNPYCQFHYDAMINLAFTVFADDPRLPAFLKRNKIPA